MRKIIAILLILIMIVSLPAAMADIDISGLSYDELVELVNKAQTEMMNFDKWQEVIVPEGVYLIGTDIPAGHWTISAPAKQCTFVGFGNGIDENGIDVKDYVDSASLIGTETSLYSEGVTSSISWELRDGQYFKIGSSSAVFTPYKGNSFQFK